MTQFEQEQAAKRFVEIWKDTGNERSEAQKFWIQLLREVYGVQNSEQYIDFELPVKIKNTSFADGFIADTKILIEMKGKNIDLNKPEKQSDGSMLTPFQQAKRYADELVYDYGVRWIITSNFQEIYIYDMKKRHQEPEILLLKNLPKEYYRLQFLVNEKDENIKREEEISFEAGNIIGKLYDEIKPLYENSETDNADNMLQDLNKLCVRIVFCLYAEDANLFGTRLMFHDYLNKYSGEDLRERLLDLFEVLNTPIEKRSTFLKDDLKEFPYVNGGLFEGKIEIPRLNDKVKSILLNDASEHFDWTDISPTIFGGLFESTLNQETRQEGGMHYTSIENIRKVIKPLFLDNLQYEYEKIKAEKSISRKREQLIDFQDKLSKLKFFDPACGSGNFLTQTYLEIRNIENEIIKELVRIDKKQIDNQLQIGDHIANPIKVSINQFYGIEINDFAVSVAKTALWIAEHQMFEKTRSITYMRDNFLPLRTYTNIVEANALKIDWNKVLPNNECQYIIGNPPFVGARKMKPKQKNEILEIFKGIKNSGNIDYVGGWYIKASKYMKNTNIQAALVSTNSICQGEQPAILWKNLIESGIYINFAYKTFRWDSEANIKAHVHCIIVGFSYMNNIDKFIYSKEKVDKVKNINCYLLDAPNIFIENRNNPISNVSKMDFGSMPNDRGYLSNYTKEQKNEIVNKYPNSEKLFKRVLGAEEFINNKERYCIWLKDISPVEYKDIKPIIEAIENVEKIRIESKRKATQKLADIPYLFGEIRQPNTDYLLVPSTSSEERNYIPIEDFISTNANLIIPNATLFEFGVLTSNVHMAWMRAVCGRLEMRYRYSAKIVYNNFPWINPTEKQKETIEKTAKSILEARKLYPECSLAELYGKHFKNYSELFKAHKNNDAAVMQAYGFDWRKMSESDCVAELMKMYQNLNK